MQNLLEKWLTILGQFGGQTGTQNLSQKWYVILGIISGIISIVFLLIRTIMGIIKWISEMRIQSICDKIIDEYNQYWPSPKIGSAAWMYLLTDKREKYKLRRKTARRCIKQLRDEGYIIDVPGDPRLTCWRKQ